MFRKKLIAEQHSELNLQASLGNNATLNQRHYHHVLVDIHAARSYTFSQAFDKQEAKDPISLKKLLLRSMYCYNTVCTVVVGLPYTPYCSQYLEHLLNNIITYIGPNELTVYPQCCTVCVYIMRVCGIELVSCCKVYEYVLCAFYCRYI